MNYGNTIILPPFSGQKKSTSQESFNQKSSTEQKVTNPLIESNKTETDKFYTSPTPGK